MYPQLMNAAARLAPALSRMMPSGVGLMRLKAQMLDAPDVNVQPVVPQDPNLPQVPRGESPLPPPLTPQERVNQAFGAPPAAQPRFNPAQSALPAPAPAAQPRFNPAQSALPEQGGEDMPWWKRNAYMQQDPTTGAFLDPSLAAQAQTSVAGPDLIQKFMKYFHSKNT